MPTVKAYCETYVKKVLPAIKAYIACTLVRKHGYSQLKVAKILGMKQPAVNYIVTGRRPIHCIVVLEKTPELKKILDDYIEDLKKGFPFDPCVICKRITSNEAVYKTVLQVASEI
jgi:predicted transcriptional regulator